MSGVWNDHLGPQLGALFNPFFGGEASPTEIDYRKKGTLILTSLLEDLAMSDLGLVRFCWAPCRWKARSVWMHFARLSDGERSWGNKARHDVSLLLIVEKLPMLC